MGRARPSRPFVSVCMIAKNEAQFIGRAIRSVRGLADEVWVGDTGSTDDTVEIAREAGAHVFQMEWPNDFAAARNRVLARARGKWILMLDADEWFPDGKARELRRELQLWDRNPRVVGFSIYQANLHRLTSDVIMDKSRTVRGFRNAPQHRYQGAIHEQILPSLRGGIVESPYEVLHAGFVQEVAISKQKGDRNRSLLVQMLEATPEDNPHRVYVLLQLGREEQRFNRMEAAVADYEEAARLFLQQPLVRTPFGAVLFAYLAEVLYKLGRDQEILDWAGRLAVRIPLTQAELPFFQGLAHLRLGHWPDALALFLNTVACLEGAPYAQEYVSFDRAVLTQAGLVECLVRLERWPEAWQFLKRAVAEYPDRQVLVKALIQLFEKVAPAEWLALWPDVPPRTLSGVAQHALLQGNRLLSLSAVNELHRLGLKDGLVWAAAAALLDGRPDLAQSILDAVPEGHASAPLARQLGAMAAWQAGDRETFRVLAEGDEPVYQAGLRLWAGEPVPPEQAGLAQAGLRAMAMVVPLPPNRVAADLKAAT
jgi:tetratricopeptide (TPR) repeat protein